MTYFPPDTQNGITDPFPPTIISVNGTQYEYARRTGTVESPADVGSLATGKLAILGTQYEPDYFVSIDIQTSIASGISKNVTTSDTIPTEFTSVYSRPSMWRTGGLYDLNNYLRGYHFRVQPFQEQTVSQSSTVKSGINGTFYGQEKNKVYISQSDLSGVVATDFLVDSLIPTGSNRARIVSVGSTFIQINVNHSFTGTSTTVPVDITRIKTSSLQNEFGFFFKNDVKFPDKAYAFYCGDETPGRSLTPTHDVWGVFIESDSVDPDNPQIPNCKEVWNFFEDLVLVGDYESIGGDIETNNPEPIVQIRTPRNISNNDKRGLHVKDYVGVGTWVDKRYQLYVDVASNPSALKAGYFKGSVDVIGTLTATTFSANSKAFNIPHPIKPNKRLWHGCLEGPEYGVYVRGRLTNSCKIELPDYWNNLVDAETITVTLTQIGCSQDLIVERIESDQVIIKSGNNANIDCYYTINATRKDVPVLEVEQDA